MKKHLLLIAALFAPVPTQASGIPVVDVANTIQRAVQHIATINKWIKQAQHMTDQYELLTNTHDALTGIRYLGNVLDDPALNQYLPDDWNTAYSELRNAGFGALAHAAIAVYNANHVYDACATIDVADMRKECEYRAIKTAKDAADADAIYAVVNLRLSQVRALQGRIDTTTDPKELGELSARIQTENAMIANEQMRLDALRLVRESDTALQQQRQREFAARTFAATEGTLIAPLTFP